MSEKEGMDFKISYLNDMHKYRYHFHEEIKQYNRKLNNE